MKTVAAQEVDAVQRGCEEEHVLEHEKHCVDGPAHELVASFDQRDGEDEQAKHETVVLEVHVVHQKQAWIQERQPNHQRTFCVRAVEAAGVVNDGEKENDVRGNHRQPLEEHCLRTRIVQVCNLHTKQLRT